MPPRRTHILRLCGQRTKHVRLRAAARTADCKFRRRWHLATLRFCSSACGGNANDGGNGGGANAVLTDAPRRFAWRHASSQRSARSAMIDTDGARSCDAQSCAASPSHAGAQDAGCRRGTRTRCDAIARRSHFCVSCVTELLRARASARPPSRMTRPRRQHGVCVVASHLAPGASGLTCELFQPQVAYQRTLASLSTPNCFVLLLVYSRAGCCVCALGQPPSSRLPTPSYLALLSFPPSCSPTSAFACSLTRLLTGGLLRARRV
jgi:hypothetical protein